jgi:hypothetical protein
MSGMDRAGVSVKSHHVLKNITFKEKTLFFKERLGTFLLTYGVLA